MEKQFSKILNQYIYIDRENKTIKSEDGLIYNSCELRILKKCRPETVKALHKIKLFFDGEIWK